jgi:sulfur transfer protein SufE
METVTVFFRDDRANPRTHEAVTDARVAEGVLRVLTATYSYLYPLDIVRYVRTELDTTD